MLDAALGRVLTGIERRINHLKSRALLARLKYAGKGSRIDWPFTIWNPHCVTLGDHAYLQWQGWIFGISHLHGRDFSPEIIIGDSSYVGPQCRIVAARRVEIGQHVMIAARCLIADNTHPYTDVTRPVDAQPLAVPGEILIGDETWIGENACIFGDVRIGRHCVIGANAVVTRPIPDYCVAVGNPARIVNRYHEATQRWEKTDPDGNFLTPRSSVVPFPGVSPLPDH